MRASKGMRREAVGVSSAILVAAVLGVAYLANSGAPRTGTSASISEGLTSFAYRTVVYSTSFSTTVENGIATTFAIRLTSTISGVWFPGQPIPVSDIETANVTVGGDPRTIAVDPNHGRIYVADWFSKNLTVVDASSHAVVARIMLPAASSNGIAIDQNTSMVYVVVSGGVAEVNGSTNKVVGELPLNFGPGSLAYNPSTHIIYGSPEDGHDDLVGADVRTGVIVANVSLGYWANSVAVNPKTNMLYTAGCNVVGTGCNSAASVVNGTSNTLVRTVRLNSYSGPRIAMDPKADVVYVSGDRLVALNGTDGNVIYIVNPQECPPIDSMAVITSSNEVIAQTPNGNYMLVYDGATGKVVNMYTLSSSLQFVAFNSATNEFYVSTSAELLAFPNFVSTGNVDTSLLGSGQNCGAT
jgi:DNA-binding beta-propeller fold protein YncE